MLQNVPFTLYCCLQFLEFSAKITQVQNFVFCYVSGAYLYWFDMMRRSNLITVFVVVVVVIVVVVVVAAAVCVSRINCE